MRLEYKLRLFCPKQIHVKGCEKESVANKIGCIFGGIFFVKEQLILNQ